MQAATFALRRQGKHDRAARTARDVLALAERLRGHAGYCFERVNALLELSCLAGAGGDDDQAHRLSAQVLAELAQGEKALAAAHAEEGEPEPAGTVDPTLWRGHLGDAYWQAAHVLHREGLITPPEALPLVRRASELHVFGPTEERLARWLLSVNGDRRGALAHLRRALTHEPTADVVRDNFARCPEWECVRDDPEFRFVIGR
jgi:hypothetical protein